MKALGCLRCILHLITSAVDKGRVSNEIRRGEDLLQACYRDLQHLIDLRNQHLEFLETTPRHIIERINTVIDLANKGLIEGRRIIEKCRPKAHRGMKMTLHSRIEWSLRSSVDFHRQESVIIRDNAAVLAELNYLRQITAWTLPGNMATTRKDPDMPLRNGQGDTKTRSASAPATAAAPMPASRSMPNLVEYCDLPEPVFPGALPGMRVDKETFKELAVQPPSAHLPAILGEDPSAHRVVLGPSDDRGLLLLFQG
ncbi:hypothetical protein X797_006563 [Metarhizium robertsii]|uniref:Uncharacterized protein n=2 Tax=Metarhizium robertsii TaxID=568076 RepID=A0A0B2XFG9_METRA|nr:uncharacterized protein MAA_11620 [Metarhizium robertsii ARSEF 23]EXV00501.1 hypothetical protein X797_006563 [Metarhizium robertsii]KHO10774.1 hypothetical protein MAA_11620 [Metarhizium robertsii ARSEF 23]